ncbi:Invasion protein B family [Pseudomonas mucidolens]|uniref:InvB/SpaK family type III secretion system chaperone n=1 Tax=Pseudomonas mucidolens TaxID=46679 RepID=UPI0030DCD69C
MHARTLDELVKAALLHSGCNAQQIGSFDSHSTIEMQMRNSPNINIGKIDDDVWVWSSVAETGPSLYRHSSYVLLQFIFKACAYARSGQIQLADIGGRLELRLMAGPQALSSAENFSAALNDFVRRIETLRNLIQP